MKNAVIKFSFAALAVIMLIACGFSLIPCESIAYAESTVSVIEAPVSNLEGNAAAGKSTLKIIPKNGNKAILIPESYFVQYKSLYTGDVHTVIYAGEEYYFKGEPTVVEISVNENELLSPNVPLTLKENANVTINGIIPITNEYTIKLLGYSEDGTELYVSLLLDGNSPLHSFIPTESVEAFTVPYQLKTQTKRDELLASKVEPPVIEDGNFVANTSVALRIVIIIGIAIPIVLIVILLFKPSKNDRKYTKNSVRGARSADEFDYDDSRSYRRRDDRDRDSRDYDRRDYERDRDRDRDYDRRDRDYDRDYEDRDRGYDRRDYDRR